MKRRDWNRVPLSAVCSSENDIKCGPFGTQLNKGEFREAGVPLWGIKQVNANFTIPTKEFLEEHTAKRLQQYDLKTDDIVMTRKGTVGNCAVYPKSFEPGIMHSDLLRLRVNPERCEPSFLVYQLHHSPDVDRQLSLISGGAIMPGINVGRLKQLEVVLPPLSEQRRIAEVLDKAEVLRAKRRAALAQLDSLTQSLFLDLFGGNLDSPAIDTKPTRSTTPKECAWVLLTEVARLATGHTPDREREDYWNGDIPWISLTDIRSLDGAVASKTLQNVTPLGIDNSSAVKLPPGTVCFSRTASVGFVTMMGKEMSTSQDFMNWVCGPMIDPIFLMWALITSRNRLLALSSGSTHRTIYMRVVEQFRVLLPPIDLQREFARRVTAVEKLKTAQRAALAELDALFASLQHRAFRGEL